MAIVLPNGVRHLPGFLDHEAQKVLLADIRKVVAGAPLFLPTMPRTGKPMSVRMTNCGSLGWVTDRDKGYRYQETHPLTGKTWPPIPKRLLDVWNEVSGYPQPPEACLVNFYTEDAKMGLHQDRDEKTFDAPVVSISLGDACRFRVGGTTRSNKTVSLRLESGDVLIMGGEGRLCFHGVDRIYGNTSPLLRNGGRINLTLRRINVPTHATTS